MAVPLPAWGDGGARAAVCCFVIEQEVESKLQRSGILAPNRPSQFDELHAAHPSGPRALYPKFREQTGWILRRRIGAGLSSDLARSSQICNRFPIPRFTFGGRN
jgi:hypothetical protein